mgnify:CR=1 FL=1
MGLKDLFGKKDKEPKVKIVDEKGVGHGDHWAAVIGDHGLEMLQQRLMSKLEQGMPVVHQIKWVGHNIQHDKKMVNVTTALMSKEGTLRDMIVLVNKSLWTSFPVTLMGVNIPSLYSVAMTWENRIEGWLGVYFPINKDGSTAYLNVFDPTFYYHRGKLPQTGRITLRAFNYIMRKRDPDRKIINPMGEEVELAENFSGVFPMGRPGLDDLNITMVVREREDIDLGGAPGYVFHGEVFGPESSFSFPIISRADRIQGEVPAVGESLESKAWVVGTPELSNVKPNGIPVKRKK